MKKQTLFFDFDDTKFHTIPAMAAHINRHYAIACASADFMNAASLESVINKYLPQEKHLSRKDAYEWLATDFLCSVDIHDAIPAIEGMVEVLPLLAKRYEIWTVTARQKVGMHVVRHMLEKHVPGSVTGIHCVWDRRDGEYHCVPKKEFISAFEGDGVAFFDDSPKEILEAQGVISSYLFDPKGHYDHVGDIRSRVRSWKEIGEMLL